jgi:hypothetical protein
MDVQTLRNLQEAYYTEVHQLDEASRADDTTRANIARYAGKKGISFEPGPNWDPSANRGRGAHLSPKQKEKQRRKALRQEQVDLYDIILSHLLDEGYAETPEAAEVMMVNMSEEWREGIMEGYKRYPAKKVGNKLDRMYDDPDTDTRFGKTGKRYSQMRTVDSHMKGEVHPLIRAHSPKKSKAKETENRKRGENG